MQLLITQDDAVVSSSDALTDAPAVRITGNRVRFTNSGTLLSNNNNSAAIVLEGACTYLFNAATGVIRGQGYYANGHAILGSAGTDTIVNEGTIDGDVELGGGADSFTQRSADQLNQLRMGDGDDLFTIETPSSASMFASGDAGWDRAVIGSAIHSLVAGLDGFEEIELLTSGLTMTYASGFQSIHLAVGGSYTFLISSSPLADLNMAGGGVTIGNRSQFRSLTGGDGIELVQMSDTTFAKGGVLLGDLSLGGGNDRLQIYWIYSAAAPAVQGNMDGGAGTDSLEVTVTGGRDYDLSRATGFETLTVGSGSQGDVRIQNATGFDKINVSGSKMVLDQSLNPNAILSLGAKANVTIEATSAVGLVTAANGSTTVAGYPAIQTANEALAVTLVNAGTIGGDVILFLGSDQFDSRAGVVTGTVYGLAGDDNILMGAGNNIVDGGYGADHVEGGAGNDNLIGGGGNDWLDGGADDDVLTGGDGNDQLFGGDGNDSLSGGAGADAIAIAGAATALIVDGGADGDTITLGAFTGAATLALGTGQDVLAFSGYTPGGALAITDFLAGSSGDRLSWMPFLQGWLTGWNGTDDLFAARYLSLVQSGADLLVRIDRDGAAGPGGFVSFMTLKDVAAPTLTAFNLDGLTPRVDIAGTEGDDTIVGTSGDDLIEGLGGNDTLAGSGGSDTIDGGDGNDALYSGTLSPNWNNPNVVPILDVGTEIDVLRGLAGDDVLFAGYGDFADGGANFDTLFISFRGASAGVTANFATLVAGGTLTIGGGTIQSIERVLWVEGSQFADTITMSNGDPSAPVYGLGGDDHIVATGGMGEIWGGEGNDTIDASNNFYSRPVYGEAGNDTILAGSGFTYGGIGNDTITGSGRLFGEEGDDTLTATPGGAFVYGGAGVDDLTGSSGGEVLSGGEGADTIVAGGGADTIYSATLPEATGDYFDHGAEHDVIDAGAGDDSVIIGYGDDADGGDGFDSLAITLDGAPGGVTLDINIAGSGFGGIGNIVNFERLDVLSGTAFADTIRIGAFNDRVQVSGGDGDDRLTATTTSVYFLAGAGNDILTGGTAIDALDGSLGNDTLIGGGGADSMDGGDDDDLLEGGLGDDTIRGGQGNDTITYAHASGAVTVHLNRAQPHSLGADGNDTIDNVENVIGSAFDDELNGDFFVNQLEGGDGNDRLNGDGGADRLIGGMGNDTYVIDNVGDQIDEAAGQGTDTVESSITFTLGATLENLTLTGSANIDGTGNGSANVLRGNEGANRLDGLGGDDELHGGGGDDLLYGGGGADVVNGGAGKDTAFVVGGTTNADTALEIVNLGSDIDRLDVDYSQITQDVVMPNPSFGPNGAQGNLEIGGSNRLSFSEIEQLTIVTGSGNDTIYGIATSSLYDQISTGSGNDTIYSRAGAGIDRIDGGTGADKAIDVDWSDLTASQAVLYDANVAAGATIGAGASQRYLRGIEQLINFTAGAGNDVITLSTDATLRNAIATGAGSDTVTYHGGATSATTAAASSVNMGTLTADDDLLILDFAAATQSVTFGAAPSVDIIGASGAILINAMTALSFTGVERLWLTTGAAADELYGGTGADRLAGGGGDDFYHVDQAADLVLEEASQGSDRVIASASYVLGANSEVETLEAVAGIAAIGLTGNQFAQTLVGNNGANVLDGRGGSDTLVGLLGDDWYHVDNAADVVQEAVGGGTDRVFASVSYTLAAGVEIELFTTDFNAGTSAINLTGNAFAQALYGNAGANSLNGGGGADSMVGLAGDDIYYVDNSGDRALENAGQGNDRVFASVSYTLETGASIELMTTDFHSGTGTINFTGNELANTIFGNDGVNTLSGGGGADTLVGRAGNDVLDGGAGIDTTQGGMGDDWHFVDNAADVVQEAAGEGSDRVFASVSYTLAAGAEVELFSTDFNAGTSAINLTGNAFAQALYGNAGANSLNGGGGADSMVGFGGDDIYYLDNSGDRALENAGEGNDRVFASVSYTLEAGASIELMTTDFHAGTGAINLTGNELANTIYGNAGVNTLGGGGGADVLIGFGGNDILDGGAGIDTTDGGAGDDWHFVDNAADVVQEAVGGGTDRVFASVSYALAAGVEVELFTTDFNGGTSAINLTGNAFAQALYGNAGANSLNGGGGADSMVGLAGDDIYYVDNSGDRALENAGEGNDRVFASVSYVLEAGASIELMTTDFHAGTGAINFTGNELANTIYGNDGVNTLNGGGGADVLIGFGGNDILDGGAGIDTTDGGAGDDWHLVDNAADVVQEAVGGGADRVFASTSYTLGAGVEVELMTTDFNPGTAAIDLTGNALAQAIYGNAGVNTLNGGGGNDVLIGAAGADTFAFTTALGAGNVDTVADFVAGTDKIQLGGGAGQPFLTLATGALRAGTFVIGAAALDADDYLIYNSGTGALLFDADGNGAGAAVQFATLATGLSLSAGDFLVSGPANTAPAITSGATAQVAENSIASTIVYQTVANDADGDRITYTLTGADAALLTIDANGAVRLITPADFETKATYAFNVVASDSGVSTSKAVTLTISDVAEGGPSTPTINETAAINDSVGAAQVIDRNTLAVATNGNLFDDDLPSATIIGSISLNSDKDFFSITLQAGELLILDIDGTTNSLDSFLTIYDASGQVIGDNDDLVSFDPGSNPPFGHNTDSQIRFRAGTGGTYYFAVSSFEGTSSGNYQLHVSIGPPATAQQIQAEDIDALISGAAWNHTNLTFGFPTSAADYPSDFSEVLPPSGFEAFNPTQQAATIQLIQLVQNVTTLTFTQNSASGPYTTPGTAAAADLRYAESNEPDVAYAYYPNNLGAGDEGGSAWFNHSDFNNPVRGNYAWMGILHETGHALGLKHGHEFPAAVSANKDTVEYTVMTYRSYPGGPLGYRNETFGYPQTLMMYDIAALQKIYDGANYTFNAGNSVYTWSTTTGEMSINGAGQGAPGANRVFLTVWDGGGTDTYDLSAYSTATTIDLRPGEWTTTSAAQLAGLGQGNVARGNVANALMFEGNSASLIENAIGGSGQDTLIANQVANNLTGNAGADLFRWMASGDAGIGALADTIADFLRGTDKIDLSAIDAIPATGGNDDFTFIGTTPFHNIAGEVRYEVTGGHAHVFADLDGNGAADMEIIVNNVTILAGTDFNF